MTPYGDSSPELNRDIERAEHVYSNEADEARYRKWQTTSPEET